jgi:hypothetical protein
MPPPRNPQVQPVAMQGIAIPAAIVDKNEFFAPHPPAHPAGEGRPLHPGHLDAGRHPAAPLGHPLRDHLHITGNLTITPGTGTVASTAEWPYNLIKNVKFNANGASSLISARGWTLRAREIAKDEGLSDRGVVQTIGGTSRNQGTLSLALRVLGRRLGNTPALGAQTNAGRPGAHDPGRRGPVRPHRRDLPAADLLAELTVEINWAQPPTCSPSPATARSPSPAPSRCSPPSSRSPRQRRDHRPGPVDVPLPGGDQLEVALQAGENEAVIVGQGAGKYVLRVIYQHYNGNGAPLPMTAANFGLQAWRYGTAETPDQWIDGSALRIAMERAYNSDLGGVLGYGVHEFAKAGFRDLVDMGTTSDLRLVSNVSTR